MTEEEFQRELEELRAESVANGLIQIDHRNGVPWWEAPIPFRWHRCKPWTTGWSGLTYVERCACGAINMPTSIDPTPYWMERNSR